MLTIGLDAGTSTLTALAWDPEAGRVLGSRTLGSPTDPEEVVQVAGDVLGELAGSLGSRAGEAVGIGITRPPPAPRGPSALARSRLPVDAGARGLPPRGDPRRILDGQSWRNRVRVLSLLNQAAGSGPSIGIPDVIGGDSSWGRTREDRMIMHLLAGFVLAQAAAAGESHEVVWLTKFQDALQLSQKLGKPLVIDAWRATCPNCMAMHQRVLPSAEVSAILGGKFVCLKVDADNPGPAEKYVGQVKGDTLPFYAYVSPDGKFISGTSGYRNAKTFLADLDGVMKNDALKVPPDLERKLAKAADQAAKDLEANKFAAVLKAAREADAARGFSASKDRLSELRTQALVAGGDKLKEAAKLCADGKFEECGAALSALARDFKGSDVEHAATVATKSLDRFKAAAKEGDPKAARHFYESILIDCKEAAPFCELAKSKMTE